MSIFFPNPSHSIAERPPTTTGTKTRKPCTGHFVPNQPPATLLQEEEMPHTISIAKETWPFFAILLNN